MDTAGLDYLDPDEIHFKIEENYKRAKIAETRLNTLMIGIKSGIPVRLAYKMSLDENLSKEEITELDENLKKIRIKPKTSH
jgi:hypothetical protein